MTYFARATLRAGLGILLLSALALSAAQASEVRTIDIRATEFSFEPDEIQVDEGETVRLRLINAGSLSHNLHLEGVSVKTETVQSDSTATVRFTAPSAGTVQFFCDVPGHKQAGMTGQIEVD